MINYKITWSPKAIKGLKKSYEYVFCRLKEPTTARNLYNKIINVVSNLQSFPERYPDISYYGKVDKNYRRLRVDKFIIIYKVKSITYDVFILNIFHSNQNYFNLL